MTSAAFAAALLIAIANRALTDRIGIDTVTTALVLAWTVTVAWGEMRRMA